MMDWFFDNVGWVLLAILGPLLVLIVLAMVEACKNDTRLLNQCLADGKKEYECVSMLRRPKSTTTFVPMPMVVPR